MSNAASVDGVMQTISGTCTIDGARMPRYPNDELIFDRRPYAR